jgi:hypothetical protein
MGKLLTTFLYTRKQIDSSVIRLMIYTLVVLALTISNPKIIASLDVKCRFVEVYRRFGGTQYFHLHGQTVRQERNQQEEGSSACLTL